MEREIIFRGKRTDNGEWVEGSLVQMLVDGRLASCIASIEEVGRANKDVPRMGILYTLCKDIFIVHPYTLGQYTGLADKNGTKIFEGDILKVFYYGKSKIFGVVKFGETRFFIDDNFMGDHIKAKAPMTEMFSRYEFEVVGNVHDNPELWKGGDQ